MIESGQPQFQTIFEEVDVSVTRLNIGRHRNHRQQKIVHADREGTQALKEEENEGMKEAYMFALDLSGQQDRFNKVQMVE